MEGNDGRNGDVKIKAKKGGGIKEGLRMRKIWNHVKVWSKSKKDLRRG